MAKPSLHDPTFRASIENRIRSLTPETRGRWGKMSVDQMLWHCSQAIASALGDIPLEKLTVPLPKSFVKFMVLNMPWVKGAPTAPGFLATRQHDFHEQQQRLLDLLTRFAARPLDAGWSPHPAFGPMTGLDYSQLQAKHFNHHLTQFGV
jgi:hypothetical protein